MLWLLALILVGFIERGVFSGVASGRQGGDCGFGLPRQLRRLRFSFKAWEIEMMCLRSALKLGGCLSTVLRNRSETSGFYTVSVALVRDVLVNLIVFSRARAYRR